MAEAAAFLIGKRDFASFMAAHSSADHAVREIFKAEFVQMEDHLFFEIAADGFLRHMIRIIMGTLLDVGRGKLSPDEFNVILKARDRKRASKTAPAHALCLLEVGYTASGWRKAVTSQEMCAGLSVWPSFD
jgi:tRNA pseudouridine38-40 synthase